jgi:hypothetical protein
LRNVVSQIHLDELYRMLYSDFLWKLTDTNENKNIDFLL